MPTLNGETKSVGKVVITLITLWHYASAATSTVPTTAPAVGTTTVTSTAPSKGGSEAPTTVAPPQPWDYKDTDNWPTIGYPDCEPSEEQSPVDVDTSLLDDRESEGQALLPTTTSPDAKAKLELLNWTMKVTWPENVGDIAKVAWEEEDYFLTSFHINVPSENTIDGKHSDMEVEILHHALDGRKLVLSVLLQASSHSNESNSYLDHLQSLFDKVDEGGTKEKVRVPYNELLPADESYYKWDGTRSQPPCEPHTIWVLLTTPTPINSAQLGYVRDKINGVPNNILRVDAATPAGVSSGWDASKGVNTRPTNPLGDRVIQVYRDPHVDHAKSEQYTSAMKWPSLTNATPNSLASSFSEQMHNATRRPNQYWWVWLIFAAVLVCIFCCPLATLLLFMNRGGKSKSSSKRRRRDYRSEPREEAHPLVQQYPRQIALPYQPYYR
mmetsp:Transcript_2029/g.5140  ORF Transcript_2029/g.5140 Transcript_2029/m.5140 type:complete len:440 (+) Transcript_2029:60-1379(+)